MSVDLRTTYLGLELANPIVPSASPLSGEADTAKRLEAAGAAAIVLPSLFEEQIEHESMAIHDLMEVAAGSFGEATFGYFPELDDYNTGPDAYLRHIAHLKGSLSIPVIASLNGVTTGGWTRHAQLMEDAGADALELNVYLLATDLEEQAGSVEQRYLELVSAVRDAIDIPLAVKVGPYFSSMASMARRLVAAGADGLVLFNRFYQPDIDLDELKVVPKVHLSTSAELLLPLRWIAVLRSRLDASLAATSGVHTAEDVIKVLLAGADVAMTASALLRRGPEHLETMLDGLGSWLEERGYASVEQMKGSLSHENSPDPAAFERANYMKVLTTYTAEVPAPPQRG